jgi:lysyl-tRNA synthetase class 2
MLSWLDDAYTRHISEPGKAGFFWLLVGLVIGFGFIRISTRLIRAEVSWWPKNVTPGGLHLHHMLFGMVFMLVSGGITVGAAPPSPWREILAVIFGIGVGLVLDEFALMLFLDDVYWREEGRISLDAVLLAVAVLTLVLVSVHPVGTDVSEVEGTTRWSIFIDVLVTGPLVIICLLKGKVYTALTAPFVSPIAVVGAVRVAKPGTPWARHRYSHRPHRLAKAVRRFPADRRSARLRRRLLDAIGGAPTMSDRGEPVPAGQVPGERDERADTDERAGANALDSDGRDTSVEEPSVPPGMA